MGQLIHLIRQGYLAVQSKYLGGRGGAGRELHVLLSVPSVHCLEVQNI